MMLGGSLSIEPSFVKSLAVVGCGVYVVGGGCGVYVVGDPSLIIMPLCGPSSKLRLSRILAELKVFKMDRVWQYFYLIILIFSTNLACGSIYM